MNLDEAIAKHAEWKVKFRAAMEHQEQVDHALIGDDHRCTLGQWLYAEGKAEHEAKPEFRFLVAKHKEFHAEAAKVAQLINTRQYAEAEKALNFATSYNTASNAVSAAILKLKKTL